MHDDEIHIPPVVASFEGCDDNSKRYCEAVRDALRKILPKDLFSPATTGTQRDRFETLFPLVTSKVHGKTPGAMSFFSLSKFRYNSFRFFFDMISHWLVPGRRMNVVLVYATDFRMPDVSSDLYTLCEVMISVEDEEELAEIVKNLAAIEAEVRLGLESSFNARRILEVRGLAADEKMALVHEYIACLTKRLPEAFDIDVLTEMQHVLITCRDDFKMARTSRHLSRIISILYLFRKAIRKETRDAPSERHLSMKLFKSKLFLPGGVKHVLAILVGVNFISDREVFEKKHVLQSIQNLVPNVHAVDGSFFLNRHGTENICMLYLEVEKTNGAEFAFEELRLLRERLPNTLKVRIGHLVHPVFMPRNDEEIMRNIVSLSNQIKYMRDIPQVIISFDEQTHQHLSFMVILVRLLKPGFESIQRLFKKGNSPLQYIHDHTKIVGVLRKKYQKEVTVFRVKLPKEGFLRRDHTIDLYKARQTVVGELSLVIGEFRDFNGGMITKQNELLSSLKDLLVSSMPYDELLLENFFFSLTPVIMRTLLEPEALKRLFLMQLELLEKRGKGAFEYRVHQDIDFLFILLKIEQKELRQEIDTTLNEFNFHSTELARTTVKSGEVWYDGYIYRSDVPAKQQRFLQAVKDAVDRSSQLALSSL